MVRLGRRGLLGRLVLLVRRVRLVYKGRKAIQVSLERMARRAKWGCRGSKVMSATKAIRALPDLKALWACRDLKAKLVDCLIF